MKHGVRNPKHIDLKHVFMQRLEQGAWNIGNRIEPEFNLAGEFGVNRHTIRKAVGALVAEGYLERIHGSGTYVRKVPPAKRPVELGLTSLIVPFTIQQEGAVSSELLAGVLEGAEENGLEIIVRSSNRNLEMEAQMLQEILTRKNHASGGLFVLDGAGKNLRTLDALRKSDFPFVLIDRNIPGVNCSFVGMDEEKACRDIAAYLSSRKHMSVLVVSCHRQVSTVQERFSFLKSAFRQTGIAVNDENFVMVDAVSGQDGVGFVLAHIREKVLAKEKPPDAIVFLNRSVAVPLMRELASFPLIISKMPEVLSFRQLPVEAPFRKGPYIDVPFVEMGREAVRILKRTMTTGWVEQVRIPGRLVE